MMSSGINLFLSRLLDASTDQGTLLSGYCSLGRIQSLLLLLLLGLQSQVILVQLLALFLGRLHGLLLASFPSAHCDGGGAAKEEWLGLERSH